MARRTWLACRLALGAGGAGADGDVAQIPQDRAAIGIEEGKIGNVGQAMEAIAVDENAIQRREDRRFQEIARLIEADGFIAQLRAGRFRRRRPRPTIPGMLRVPER